MNRRHQPSCARTAPVPTFQISSAAISTFVMRAIEDGAVGQNEPDQQHADDHGFGRLIERRAIERTGQARGPEHGDAPRSAQNAFSAGASRRAFLSR